MSRYVPDVLSHRWVIISPSRVSRPEEKFDGKKHSGCLFCPGNETKTSEEVFRIGKGEKNELGWSVRVIANRFPITDFHEVIIHSPNNTEDIEELPLHQVELILKTYRERYNLYRSRGQVLIFCNHGEHAGASIEHPHSQLVVIPSQINLDSLSREPLNNMVEENTYFHVYCPDFSQWPYEVWIAPKAEGTFFGDLADEEIKDLALLIQKFIKQLKKIYHHHQLTHMPFGYNYYIYPKENWYLRIIPRFIHRAGFELGTGLSVNIVDPILAAMALSGIDEKTANVLSKLKKKL